MAALGKEEVQMGLNTGNRLFDVVRAMIIFTRFFVDQSRMLETWAYVGLVTRMITPLGLTVRSAEFSLKSVMLPPPVDALEREERNITVWIAVFHETISSAASSWGGTMALDEVSICLPVAAKDFPPPEKVAAAAGRTAGNGLLPRRRTQDRKRLPYRLRSNSSFLIPHSSFSAVPAPPPVGGRSECSRARPRRPASWPRQ
jgi:hypothetical protein